MKKKIIILVITTLVVVVLLISAQFVGKINILWLRLSINILINLLIGLTGFIAIKLSGIEIDFKWKDYKQYLIGIAIAILLSLAIAWIPALCGFSLIGNRQNFVPWIFFFELLYFFLVIGPVEELLFRIYYQNVFVGFFTKHKWIGVIIASTIFGLFHIFNGIVNVLFAFGIGLIFGFAKQYIKHLHYPGISVCHGLYDFLAYVVRITIA